MPYTGNLNVKQGSPNSQYSIYSSIVFMGSSPISELFPLIEF